MRRPGFSFDIARNADAGGGSGKGAAGSGGNGGTPAGGGGGGDSAATPSFDWAGALGERQAEFAPVVAAKGWQSPADALSAFTTLEKDAAARVAIPGTDATDEDRAAFYKALGRPDKPEDYGFQKPEGLSDADWDMGRMTRFAGAAHTLGLSAAQAKGIMDFMAKDMGDEIAAFEAELPKRQADHAAKLNEGINKLWGPKAPAQLDIARRAFQTYATDDKAQAAIDLLSEKMGELPVIQIFAAIGHDMGEAKMKGGGGSFGANSPAEAKATLDAKMKDQEWTKALYTADHPKHSDVVEERRRLLALALNAP